MMKKTKLFVAIAAMAGLSWGTMSYAGPQTNVNLYDGNGTLLAGNITALDWNEQGSGLGIDFITDPVTGAPTVDSTFTLAYQSNLVAYTPTANKTFDAGALLNQPFDASGSGIGCITAPGCSTTDLSGYEFTIAARFQEKVTSVVFNPDSNTLFTVFFEPVANSGTVSIFYDDGRYTDPSTAIKSVIANVSTGIGFDDGLEIARFAVDGPGAGVQSNFSVTALGTPFNTGTGTTKFGFTASGLGSFVNPSFIQGLSGGVFDLHFDSNQQQPPGTSLTDAFHTGQAQNTSNIYPTVSTVGNPNQFKVDGSSTFTTVPEPSTMLLFAGSLLGFGLVNRRRRPFDA